MRKSWFTEFQIVKILKSVEGGIAVKDACREHGSSSDHLLQVEIQVRRHGIRSGYGACIA